MKKITIDGKTLVINTVAINKKKKEVIVASENQNIAMAINILKICEEKAITFKEHEVIKDVLEKAEKKLKLKTVSTCHEKDDFDPAVGVALALCYNMFGSKTKFHKFVNQIVEDTDKIADKKAEKKMDKALKKVIKK